MKIRAKFTIVSLIPLLIFILIFFLVLLTLIRKTFNANLDTLRNSLVKEKKAKLMGIVSVAYTSIEKIYAEWEAEEFKTPEKQVQHKAKEVLRYMRYDNGIGYIWINNTAKPYPYSIMHPISKEIDKGVLLKGDIFNTTKGTGANFCVEYTKVCEASSNGEGFVEHTWEKPTKDGTTKEALPKLTAVKLFKPWQWIIGTGFYIDDIDILHAEMQIKQKSLLAMLGTLSSVILIISFILIMLVTSKLSHSILKINKNMHDITSQEGKIDFSKSIKVVSRDEIGEIANVLNKLLFRFNNDILRVKNASINLGASANKLIDILENNVNPSVEEMKSSVDLTGKAVLEQITSVEQANASIEEFSRNVNSISNNIDKQASAVEESASAIEEMSRNIESSSISAGKTRDISQNLNQMANEGGTAVKSATSAIREVSEYSQQILKMLKLITDISKQTNLLAMNASIEAAHAGDAGKGFAIVAEEIRRLSENTNKNAKDIGEVVNTIVEKIAESVQLAEKAGIGLDMILAYSQQNMQSATEMNTIMEEQSHSAKEILQSTQDIVGITEEIKTAMIEQKLGAEEFSETMQMLKIMSVEIQTNIHTHTDSTIQLTGSIENISDISIKNQKLSELLNELIEKFELTSTNRNSATGDESTAMKLVE